MLEYMSEEEEKTNPNTYMLITSDGIRKFHKPKPFLGDSVENSQNIGCIEGTNKYTDIIIGRAYSIYIESSDSDPLFALQTHPELMVMGKLLDIKEAADLLKSNMEPNGWKFEKRET